MADNSIEVRFDFSYKCKNSVRYNPYDDEAKKMSGGFYLMNALYEKLGKPKTITITVRPITVL